ncbi:hypothetical protein JCM10213_004338 [Rhodosporidiobolus nylandii]
MPPASPLHLTAFFPPSQPPSNSQDGRLADSEKSLLPYSSRASTLHSRAASHSLCASATSHGGRRRRTAALFALVGVLGLGMMWKWGEVTRGRALGWREQPATEEKRPLFTVDEEGVLQVVGTAAAGPSQLQREQHEQSEADGLLFPPVDQALPPSDDASPFSEPDLTSLHPVRVIPSLYAPPPPSHPLSLLVFSRLPPSQGWECLDAWVARGEVCSGLAGAFAQGEVGEVKLDVMWTWVNGSEARMREWREEIAKEEDGGKGDSGAEVLRHFREHDELRYSVRSVASAFPPSALGQLHLIAGDIPAFPLSFSNSSSSRGTSGRLVQKPSWLSVAASAGEGEAVSFASSSSDTNRPVFRLHAHSELFRTTAVKVKAAGGRAGEAEKRERAEKWRDGTVPSFNSLAIESQSANLDTLSPSTLALNDDFFLLKPLSTSDVDSPLTGSVFRMFRDFSVEGARPEDSDDDPEGEWRGLKYSAWILDRRFGKRKRPYLAHVAKSIPMPLFRELHAVFFGQLETQTSASRFRGRGPAEVTPHFMLQHYVLEKHREALLWSYVVARSDSDGDGFHSVEERSSLLHHLCADAAFLDESSSTLYASSPRRTSLSALANASSFSALPSAQETTFEFLSQDGFCLFAADDSHEATIPHWAGSWPSFAPSADNGVGSPCALRLVDCFGEAFLDVSQGAASTDASELLKRIAFERPECGDCLIVQLLAKSGERGLEAFLPEKVEKEQLDRSLEVVTVGTSGMIWKELDFNTVLSGASRRQQAISLIQRYAYSIGTSPFAFLSVGQGGDPLTARLSSLIRPVPPETVPAFVALNDDIASTDPVELADVDERLQRWFREVWPEPSEWEGPGG